MNNNNKVRDIIVIVVALVIMIGAIIFVMESSDGSKTVNENSFEKIEVERIETTYNKSIYDKINSFIDYGKPIPSNLGKQNLFVYEEGANPNQDNTPQARRNAERLVMFQDFVKAISLYYQEKNEVPETPSDGRMASLFVNGSLSEYTELDSFNDSSNENTRFCYAKSDNPDYPFYYLITFEPVPAPLNCKTVDFDSLLKYQL